MVRNENKRKLAVPAILIILTFLIVWRWGVLNISQVDVRIDNTDCLSEQDLKANLVLEGQNILFISGDVVSEKLLREYPCIGKIKIERQYPRDLKVIVESRVAIAKIVSFKPPSLEDLEASPSTVTALIDWSFPSIDSQELFLVDRKGFIFGKDNGDSLPLVLLPEDNLQVGRQLNQDLFDKISSVLAKIPDLQLLAGDKVEAKVSDNVLLVRGKTKVAFSLTKDVLKQLASLQLILQKAKIDMRVMETIDLRFDKPVVTYFTQSK